MSRLSVYINHTATAQLQHIFGFIDGDLIHSKVHVGARVDLQRSSDVEPYSSQELQLLQR